MKKAMYFAYLAMLVTATVSCSSEDIYQEPVEESVSVRDFKNIDFSKAWEGLELNINFSHLFDYSNAVELKSNSDETFAAALTELRQTIEERKDGTTDMVTSIYFTNGKARVRQHLFIDATNNDIMKELTMYLGNKTLNVPEISEGNYKLPQGYTLLTDDMDNNITMIGDFLVQNLIENSDIVTVQLRVNAGKSSVYVHKS